MLDLYRGLLNKDTCKGKSKATGTDKGQGASTTTIARHQAPVRLARPQSRGTKEIHLEQREGLPLLRQIIWTTLPSNT